MPSSLTRIFSDLHFADRASSLNRLASLDPLFEGATDLVLNGDTIETRPSPFPDQTTALRAEMFAFFGRATPPTMFLTGNHDPDISTGHHFELAGGRVFVTHGDALFDDLVPWSQDASLLRQRITAELAQLSLDEREQLPSLLAAYRRVAAGIPQRHQFESHGLKYLIGFMKDTIWPPTRILRVFRAWRTAPRLAEAFVQKHQPRAQVFAMGHTHRLGAVRTARGLLVLNTGSFCPPCAPGVIDVTADRVVLRRVDRRGGELRLGASLVEFSLAGP